MLKLERVASFLAVVEHGSFHAAANRRGLSQPAVSQHVQQLESNVGAPLLERGHARVHLTAAGKTFLPHARHLIRSAERALGLFRHDALRVAASSNAGIYLLPRAMKAFQDETQAAVEMTIEDNLGVLERLSAMQVDVAVMEWWDGRPGFHAEVWRRERLMAIVPEGHAWADLEELEPRMLVAQPLIAGESGTGTMRLLRTGLGPGAAEIRLSLSLGSTEAVKQAVSVGLGVSVVLEGAVTAGLAPQGLRAIPIASPALFKEIMLVRRDHDPDDGLAARFAAFLIHHASGTSSSAWSEG